MPRMFQKPKLVQHSLSRLKNGRDRSSRATKVERADREQEVVEEDVAWRLNG